MTDQSLMPFGKYKGEKLANVPADYLLWLLETGKLFPDLKQYIESNRDALDAEVKRSKAQRGKR